MRLIIFIVILLLLSCEEPMVDGCTTTTACNYNADATKDDGSCLENDCAGECGGSAVIDECEVCGGGGIDDGDCDCDGNTEDCAGECGGDAVEDECGVCNIDQPIGPYQCCDGYIQNCTPELGDSCCLTRFVADGECDGAAQPYGCDLRCYDCAVKECNGWPCPIEDYPDNCVDGDGEILPLCGNPLVDSCIEAVYNEDWNPDHAQAGDGGDCECTPMTLADCLHEGPMFCGIWPDGCGGEVDCEDHCSEQMNSDGEPWPLHCMDTGGEASMCSCDGDPINADPTLCCPGQVPNCVPDYENTDPSTETWACVPTFYIGSGECDNSCQPYGWDLTCYDCAHYGDDGLCDEAMPSTSPANYDGGDCRECDYEEAQSWCGLNHWCGNWATNECGCWECGDCIGVDEGLDCGEDQICR